MTDTKRTVVIDGVSVEMETRDAQVIERAFRTMEDQLRDLAATIEAKDAEMESAAEEKAEEKKKTKEEVEKKDAIIVAKDAAIAGLKQQLADAEMTPDKLDALVDARSVLVDRARAVLADSKAEFKGKALNDIRRAVVDSKLGDKAKGWSDAQVEAVFDSFTIDTRGTKAAQSNGMRDAVAVFQNSFSLSDTEAAKAEMYDAYDQELANAWQPKA